MADHLELYQRLGFEDNKPTLADIKRRYRKLVQTCHPDKFTDPDEKEHRTEQFHRVQEAYDILSNEERRAAYDRDGLINTVNEEQQVEQAAVQILIKMFNLLIDQIDEDRLTYIDIRRPIFDLVHQNKEQHQKNLETRETNLRKIKVLQVRLNKNKGEGSDILQLAMSERVGATNAEIKNITTTLKVFDKVKELLENYNYDFTNPQEEFMRYMNTTTTGPVKIRFI